MARYTSSFNAGVPLETAHQSLVEILRSCGCEVIYETEEYIMAREKPGNVSYAKLVTIEALIDATRATQSQVHIKIVAKNEELPLQVDNHCRQFFDGIENAIVANNRWEHLENALN
ncbi:hypothetical protein [Merismopedia glauca]|uniref:Uncharacterized protein n=1 Tax=Merismopedia glauca CCAP 1448/3 TaxID=1296344 RepID=A0A2T1C346_9CYAN|nr:hypothetical protein [Merismopedia glauca]PSB02689.1 hypothetical protein C7B64_11985 [Merismopedia glauca CCAP 1448/3]